MTPGVVMFWLLATMAVGTGILVVALRSPVYSAIALVANMLVLAGLYLSLSAQFIAAVQVIVYAGAIMVLFVFVVMLLGPGTSASSARTPVLGGTVAVVLAAALGLAIAAGGVWRVGLHGSKATAETLAKGGTVEAIGYAMFDPELPWLLPFELTSIVLLLGAVGAVVLARRRS